VAVEVVASIYSAETEETEMMVSILYIQIQIVSMYSEILGRRRDRDAERRLVEARRN
jgi:hypothetical protein